MGLIVKKEVKPATRRERRQVALLRLNGRKRKLAQQASEHSTVTPQLRLSYHAHVEQPKTVNRRDPNTISGRNEL